MFLYHVVKFYKILAMHKNVFQVTKGQVWSKRVKSLKKVVMGPNLEQMFMVGRKKFDDIVKVIRGHLRYNGVNS